MATCFFSGEICEDPVVSKKSGHVFERRLIEKHIKATGKCPATGENLTEEDLLPLKTNKAVKPRPPSATSMPSLLTMIQNEWDSLMLESYTLKQQVETLRQELARALYQQDASKRVIARLIKERDAARATLQDTQANLANAIHRGSAPSSSSSSASAMDTSESEETGITHSVVEIMSAKAKDLTSTRKKRVKDAVAEVTPVEALKSYSVLESHPLHSANPAGITALDINSKDQNLILTGGNDSNIILFNRGSGKILDTLKGHTKKITDVKFHPDSQIIFSSSADNSVCIWGRGNDNSFTASPLKIHSAPVCGISIHPTGQFFVSASQDKSWAFYDVSTCRLRQQVRLPEDVSEGFSTVSFHPDGLILGTGSQDGTVRVWEVSKQKTAVMFRASQTSISSLSFSENGYHLATGDHAGIVKLWDLRKLSGNEAVVTVPITGENVVLNSIQFDASGSYLAAAGSFGVRMFSGKELTPVLEQGWTDHEDVVTSVRFGSQAKFFCSVSQDRTLKVYGQKQ